MGANNMAMREALVKIEKMAHCDLTNVYPRYRDKFNDKIGGIEREARAALAAPPRNCDHGTAEEQCDRFLRFCQSRGCVNCEIGDGNRAKFPSCELVWGQMPYAEGGSK